MPEVTDSPYAPSPAEVAEIEEYRSRYGRPGMTAGEFGPYLPDRLKGPYWRLKIAQALREMGIDPGEESL